MAVAVAVAVVVVVVISIIITPSPVVITIIIIIVTVSIFSVATSILFNCSQSSSFHLYSVLVKLYIRGLSRRLTLALIATALCSIDFTVYDHVVSFVITGYFHFLAS